MRQFGVYFYHEKWNKVVNNMSDPNQWYFFEASPLPRTKVLSEKEKGKEIYVFQREHPEYGLMSISVLASNGKEAREIIDSITK